MGCVQWSHNKTTRSIRHIQLRENHVCENVQNKNVQIKHTAGKTCLADIFTKEDKDKPHFLKIRNQLVKPNSNLNQNVIQITKNTDKVVDSCNHSPYCKIKGGC